MDITRQIEQQNNTTLDLRFSIEEYSKLFRTRLIGMILFISNEMARMDSSKRPATYIKIKNGDAVLGTMKSYLIGMQILEHDVLDEFIIGRTEDNGDDTIVSFRMTFE